MSKLEELLPELAGVFAAQESAMENVVSLLTTQVAQLIQDSDAQNRRVALLEASQHQLQDALVTLRKAYDSLADQQSAAQASHTEAVGTMAASVQGLRLTLQQQLNDVEGKWQNVEARLEAAGAGPSETQVMDLVGEHLNAVETKLTAHLEHRLLETSNRSYFQVQHAEEAMKTELEMLEKKFEYLSRVKMEIKDLNKKIEKQDQTLDDMRMGMELLAKSIGTDESDNEGDNGREEDEKEEHDENRKPIRRVDHAEVMNVMKRISLSSTDIQAKIDENAALLAALLPPPLAPAPPAVEEATAQETTTTRMTRSKSASAVPAQQPAFTRRKTVDVPQNARETESMETTGQIATSRGKRAPIPSAIPLKSTTSPPDNNAESVTSPHTPASIPETFGDTANELAQEEETDGAANNASSSPETTPPAAVADIVEESPEDLVEAADVIQPSAEETPAQGEELPPPGEQQEEQAIEPEIREVVPEQAPEVVAEEEEEVEEAEESDRVVEILSPVTSRTRLGSHEKLQQQHSGDPLESGLSRSSPSMMQHMPTTPNLAMLYPTFNASTTMIRSRRATRMLKRQNSNIRKDSTLDSSRSETRTPMAKDTIKVLWRRMFTRFVQFKRLQILNGASPDKIFRKQNMSVGARVKRLEETTADLEEMVDVLEVTIQQNSQNVQQLAQGIAQHQVDVDAKVDKLNEDKQLQGQMIIGVEEKLDLIELDLRRVRSSSRRESVQSASSAMVNSLTTQQQELAGRFSDHVNAFQAVEHAVTKLSELELPALTTRFETMLHDFRHEMDHKSKELAKELNKSIDRVQETQAAAEASLLKRTNTFVERLYRDIMNLSKAHLVSLEMVRSAKSSSIAATSTRKKLTLFDVSLKMLQRVFLSFQNDCKSLQGEGESTASSILGVLLERVLDFLDQLEKLKEQSAKAKTSAIAGFGAEDDSGSSSFTDRLVLMTTTQLKALEALLTSDEHQEDEEDAESNSDALYQIKDLVVQLRSVLILLFLHAELLDPHQKLQVVLSTQDSMHKEIRVHDFSISQLNTVGATVKMMNTRLDSFLEMSYLFAKDEDVKKSIQEMLSSSESVRDNLSQQLETTHLEAQKRDEILERELTQLVGRVNKKLDKDELLWTQEVIERQLQSVAKSSLGEDDLIDIHRLLRNKLDKTYFNALLAEQRNRAAENSGDSGGIGVYEASSNGVPGNSPLIGAKCISCNNELPPTKAMIKSVVKDQVHQEVAKTLARQQQQPSSGRAAPGASSFNASTHRSMEKHKKELLVAALQQQQQQKNQNRK